MGGCQCLLLKYFVTGLSLGKLVKTQATLTAFYVTVQHNKCLTFSCANLTQTEPLCYLNQKPISF